MTFQFIHYQKPFYESCISNHRLFQEYYEKRTCRCSTEIDRTPTIITCKLWLKLGLATKSFQQIEHTTKLDSGNAFQMSAYLPVIQALRNSFNKVLNNLGRDGFDELSHGHVRKDLTNFVCVWLNINDKSHPRTQKVGLLDEYQLWANCVDPTV